MDKRRMGTALLFAMMALSGCAEDTPPLPGEAVLQELEAGILQSEVMERFPDGGLQAAPGAGGATQVYRQGYRVDRYLIEGETVEVVWLHETGADRDVEDARRELNPVIFRGNLLDGWGWTHFDARAGDWGLTKPADPSEG
jgi:hypothetical protein